MIKKSGWKGETVNHITSLPAIWTQIWLWWDLCPRHRVQQTTQVDTGSMACEEPRGWSNWGNGGHTHKHTLLIKMVKTGWCKRLDKVSNKQHSIPNATSTCVQHPTRTPTLAQPTTHHAQPRHKSSRVHAPETQKQQQAHTCSPTHIQHQITCK